MELLGILFFIIHIMYALHYIDYYPAIRTAAVSVRPRGFRLRKAVSHGFRTAEKWVLEGYILEPRISAAPRR